MAGRKRKPAEFHDATKDRNYSKAEIEKMRKAEDSLKGLSEKVSDTPEHLSDLAKEYYNFIVKETEVSGILSNLDIPIVSLTAQTLAYIREAEEDIAKDGMFYYEPDRNGHLIKKKNPSIDVRDKALTQVKTLFTQLGMSPSARASLAVANIEKEKEEQDPLMQVLKKSK